jgi:hypothetical protein
MAPLSTAVAHGKFAYNSGAAGHCPQRLKPPSLCVPFGTAEAVP